MKVEYTINGTACRYDIWTKHNCIFGPGAFRAIDPETPVPLLYSHGDQLGWATVRGTRDGIECVEGTFVLDTERAWDAWIIELLRLGLLRHFSIGWSPVSYERSQNGIGPLIIKSAVLDELSICREGANPAAQIRSITSRALTANEILAGVGS